MNIDDWLYRLLKVGELSFDGAHNIHTPRDLVEEILSQIDLNGDILVLFNLEFVISLVYTYQVDPSRITFYSDHETKNSICSRLGVKYITNLEVDMKFDVVIGNPPYQGDSNNSIWKDFLKKVIELDPNIICFITPRAILNGAKNDNQNLFLHLKSGLRFVKYVPARTFKVGKMIAAWVYDKNFNGTAKIIIEDGSIIHDNVSQRPFLPYLVEDERSFKIAIKLLSFAESKSLQSCYDEFPESLSGLVIPKNKHMSLKHRFVVDDKNDKSQIKSKQFYFLPLIKTDHVMDYIDHPVFKFMWKILGISDGLGGTFFRKIPYLDLSRSWTEEEIYKHFGLIQEEIDYIEANVK